MTTTHIEANGKIYQTRQHLNGKWYVNGFESMEVSYKKALRFIRELIIEEKSEPTLF